MTLVDPFSDDYICFTFQHENTFSPLFQPYYGINHPLFQPFSYEILPLFQPYD